MLMILPERGEYVKVLEWNVARGTEEGDEGEWVTEGLRKGVKGGKGSLWFWREGGR